MKRLMTLLLAAVMCISLAACGGSTEPETLTVEDAYAQLVACAKEGKYLEGWRVTQKMPSVKEYQDGQAYYDYCEAMRAYEAGGIGFAYSTLLTIPHILNAQAIIDTIAEQIGHLNGYYVADNGRGSYLHLVIRDGKVATAVIGYKDEEQTFQYTDSDFMYALVQSSYSDGTEFLAIGQYRALGAEVIPQYVVNTFDDSSDLMVIKYADYEYATLNGLYTKVANLQAS